ncbi:helix-turn-helix domain-containing protein [Acinetobacter zhairhuonensis]|uniref:helix-turn-helix domain-containing protein n=1 Tax=Acinetobacter sp. A7.4 TaxID=2919921 RepID=UPI001F4FEAB8|nr:helix-turn-helix domain-containing protein [Acinetobacter sp. A7.4]MCJ8162340.1 helix-turn-helix domain-containing protein [Acinetobacter sp. A7.4]
MSIDATRWAWAVEVKSSAQRLVLLSLADRAGEEHTAWPSIDRLAKDTVLDKKTVQKVILELINIGLVLDTGDRAGPTKRVRVLKLVGVKGREDYSKDSPKTDVKKEAKNKANTPNNGNIEQTQKRDDSNTGNDSQNRSSNEPTLGMQNLKENLPMNLSYQHEWMPNQQQLETKLKIAGHERNLELIMGLPSFEFELSHFNSYCDGKVQSDSQKLHRFTAWIIDKFERYQRANPSYVSSVSTQTEALTQPFFDLNDRKPKGLLGST